MTFTKVATRRVPILFSLIVIATLTRCTTMVEPQSPQPPRSTASVSLAATVTPTTSVAAPPTAQRTFASGARGTRQAGLLTYTSKPWGFDTNSYFLEGPDGLVMIDTQFLPSAAEEAVEWAEAETGRKVELAVVLHANPDKFNGTEVLQARGVRVVTSQAVATLIPAVHAKRKGWFFDRYAPDYPQATPAPEVVPTGVLKVAGLELTLRALGQGCSEAHLVIEHEAHLFVGDVVAQGTHAWLELGHIEAWGERLDELAALHPSRVHPGRGMSGDAALLVAQRRYLGAVAKATSDAVRNANHRAEPTAADLTALREALTAAYPDLGYEVFLKLGLPAVWRQSAKASARR